MEVITSAVFGAASPKEQVSAPEPAVEQITDARDAVPELAASEDSIDGGRNTSEYAPIYTRAQSAENISLPKNSTDLEFMKDLDEDGLKELMMFFQAPSSVILQSILEYQPAASFGFVKTHVHDGLSDDECAEYDADDMTPGIFPTKTAKYVATGAAAVGTAAVVSQRDSMSAATRHFTPDPAAPKASKAAGSASQRESMSVATKHFTPDPSEQKKQKAAVAAGSAAVAAGTVTAVSRSQSSSQRDSMPAAVRHFTPDPEEEKARKAAIAAGVSYADQRAAMPAAVAHFTPDWEQDLPPTVRESLDKMSPEQREVWLARPIAVLHFTPNSPEFEKKEYEMKPYEMPIAMKHFAPAPKEKKEWTPDPVPAAIAHFTPDWEAEAAKKKALMNQKQEMPAAVKHFTPEWEVFIPPTVREALATMTPEERKKWADTPTAVSHFTPYEPPKEAAKPYEMPIAVKKFTPDPNAPPAPIELDWEAMPLATRHFTPDPNVKKVHVFEPAPAAVRHFTPNIDEIEAARKA